MRGRVPRALLLAGVLLAACGDAALQPPPTFGIDEAERARRALADVPQAVEHFRAGRYARAAAGFADILETLPGCDQAATAAALLQLDGPTHFHRLRSSVETNLGLCHLRARRYAVAAEVLAQAVESDPRSPVARSNLGVALLRAKRYRDARRELEEALRRGAVEARVHLHLGEAALRGGDPRRAAQALRRAQHLARAAADVESQGVRRDAERLLAELALARGRPREARRRLESVLAETPGDPLPRYLLLGVLVRLGDAAAVERHRALFLHHAATMASLQSALSESPDEVAGLHWIADTYLSLGLDHLADTHYRQLLARDPDDRAARRGLLTIHARLVASRGETR